MYVSLILSVLALILFSCGPAAQKASGEGEYAKEVRTREPELPKCERPLGTIVARGFKCKAAACTGGKLVFGKDYVVDLSPKVLGEGLSDMLVTTLVKTGCFKVLERETLEAIKEELELHGVDPRRALKGADFLITGAITALEMQAGGAGGGGLMVPLPFIGGVGVKAGKSKAHIALDLRLVRVRDAEILVAETVEGKSERWKFGVGGGGVFGTVVAGGWFEAFKNTPMEEATRDLIYHAVKLIVEQAKLHSASLSAPQEAPLPGQGVKRSRDSFRHGKVVWEEDFSDCGVVPKGFRMLRGSAECVEFSGKKWIATVKGNAVLSRRVEGFRPGSDWALEFTVYLKGGRGMYAEYVSLAVGREDSPLNLTYRLNGEIWINDKQIPSIQGADGGIHRIGLVKRGNTLTVYVDGVRWATLEIDNVALSRMDGVLVFNLHADDIETGDYAFITDLKLSLL